MIGLIPDFFSVFYIIMNPVMRYSFFLDLIPVARIGPGLLSSITITYQFAFAGGCGNAPVWSLNVIPFSPSNFTAVICTM